MAARRGWAWMYPAAGWMAGVLAVVVWLAAGAGPAPAAGVAAGPGADDASRVLRDVMDAAGVPGYALVTVTADGTVDPRGFGRTGTGHRVSGHTPFVLGSTSKSFTALAAVQLADRGKLDLDAPIRDYVPEFSPADRVRGDRITVRDALRQTTGIPATAGGPVLGSVRDGSASEAVKELRGVKLAAAPGSRFIYANANYVLAGLAVERASGEPYARYVERHIFAPLGMSESFTGLAAARRAGLTPGHRFLFGRPVRHGPTLRRGIQASGYLVSSARDIGRYLSMYLHDGRAPGGERVVSKAGLGEMFAPGRRATLGPWADRAGSRYGMGWYIGGPWPDRAMLHPGRTPDSGSLFTLVPERRVGIATLVNAANQLSVPGYPASIDRAQRLAVDALLDAPSRRGTSLGRFYLAFDLAVLVLLAAAFWLVVRSAALLRPGRDPGKTVTALTAAGLAAAGLVLAILFEAGLGWRTWFLWQPDLALAAAVLAALLLISAGVRTIALLGPLRRRGSGAGQRCI